MRYSYKGGGVYHANGSRRIPRPIMNEMNQPVVFDADHTWYAAAYVTRINNGYLKQPKFDPTSFEIVARPNKEVVREILDSKLEPWTAEDISLAEECRNYWQGQILKLLGGPVNDFTQQAVKLAGMDSYTTQFEISVVSYLISSALKGIKNDDIQYAKETMSSDWIGQSDEKVNVTVTILQTRYVQSVGRYIIEGHVNGKDLVSWWSGKDITDPAVDITARIRSLQTDKHNPSLKITFLNYVKIKNG